MLALVVSPHNVDPAGFAKGIQLIDKNNARSVGRRLGKEIANARGSHAHEHLHELGPADAEEWYSRLPGHSLGQKGFASPRRANQKHPFGNPPPELLEFIGSFQKFHHFLQLFLGLIDSSYIGESDLRLILCKKLGFAFTERHDPHPRPHLFHSEPPDQKKNADGEDPGENTAQKFTLIVSGVTDLVFIQTLHQFGIIHPNRGEFLARLFFFSF